MLGTQVKISYTCRGTYREMVGAVVKVGTRWVEVAVPVPGHPDEIFVMDVCYRAHPSREGVTFEGLYGRAQLTAKEIKQRWLAETGCEVPTGPDYPYAMLANDLIVMENARANKKR